MERKLNAVADGWELNQLFTGTSARNSVGGHLTTPTCIIKEKHAILASWASMHVRWKPRELRSAQHGSACAG